MTYSYSGQLYIISAPSGAGKSSLLTALINNFKDHNFYISISHTTREKRGIEKHGIEYYFIDKEEFKKGILAGEFLEHAEVFGNYYGTSKKLIEQNLKNGIDVFLDIDWQGARQVRKLFPYVKSIFIIPPSLEELESRLKIRAQDSSEVIIKRMSEAKNEISHCNEYDYLIINDDFNKALLNLSSIIKATKNSFYIQQNTIKDLLDTYK
ncbi:MAG: guanylate kinase [Psittacicella sp.]